MPNFMLSCSSSCSFYFSCFSSFPILFTCCWLCTVSDFICSSLFCSTTLILSSWFSLTCMICSSICCSFSWCCCSSSLCCSTALIHSSWSCLICTICSFRTSICCCFSFRTYLSLLEVSPECAQSICLSVPDTLEIHLATLVASLQTLGLASCSQMPSVPSVFECCLQCVSPCLASEASQCKWSSRVLRSTAPIWHLLGHDTG